LEQRKYKRAQANIVTLQAIIRGVIQRNSIVALQKAAIIAQSIARGKRDRAIALRERSARTIQTWWRMARQRKQYLTDVKSIIAVQAIVRCRQAEKNFEKQRQAAISIQKQWRGFQARKNYTTQRQAAIAIQVRCI